MPRRLASAAAALFLALQFVLLGSGFTCITPNPAERGMSDRHMNMGSASMTATVQAPAEQEPCHAPGMPSESHAMAPCAAAAVAAPVPSFLIAPSYAHEAERLIVLTPPSRTTPPDLPPPRA